MGGSNFLVHYRVITRHPKALIDNAEMRYWWGLISSFTALILLERFLRVQPFPAADLFGPPFWHRLEEDFRIVLFQVVSIITTHRLWLHRHPLLWRSCQAAFSGDDG